MPRARAPYLGPIVRRPLIADTAVGLFANAGWSATSMAVLAERCQVSKAVLYDCFPRGKEELFAEVLEVCSTRCLEALDTIPPETRLFIAELGHRVDEGRTAWGLIVLPIPELPDRLVSFQRAHRLALLRAVARRAAPRERSRRRRAELERRFAAVIVLTLFADHLQVAPHEVDAIVDVLFRERKLPAVC